MRVALTNTGTPRAPSLTHRLAAVSLLAALTLATTSYLINVLCLGPSHDALDIFRPDEDFRRMPGLCVSSLIWGTLLTTGYRIFWRGTSRRSGAVEGAFYGLMVCLFFTIIQSIFLYQFVRITLDLLLGDVVCYLAASTLGGALIGALVPRRAGG